MSPYEDASLPLGEVGLAARSMPQPPSRKGGVLLYYFGIFKRFDALWLLVAPDVEIRLRIGPRPLSRPIWLSDGVLGCSSTKGGVSVVGWTNHWRWMIAGALRYTGGASGGPTWERMEGLSPLQTSVPAERLQKDGSYLE
ncbi:hypothetical protein NPIL_677501 [Nephila pilipes]|uniref:Uncharacterized protein n=1 Tax=Nephila pilipes TaxID=299642 RepID=A0A8X6U2P3_NEPPI|nr:hypothetical protein NPIL_677501 [Nephila pilipes]